jgi:hypothetical protein
MLSKYLKLIFLLIVSSFVTINAEQSVSSFAHPSLGKTYKSVREFVIKEYGKNFQNNNIEIVQLDNNKKYYWVIDRTPSVNYTWFLIDANKKNSARVILYVLAAETVTVVNYTSRNNPELIHAVIPSFQGLPGKEMDFRFDKTIKIFKPIECRLNRVNDENEVISTESVPCEEIFEK